jgi:hypothetical protein
MKDPKEEKDPSDLCRSPQMRFLPQLICGVVPALVRSVLRRHGGYFPGWVSHPDGHSIKIKQVCLNMIILNQIASVNSAGKNLTISLKKLDGRQLTC